MGTPGTGTEASRTEQEFQLETRHLVSLIALVVVLCVASFMLGRWAERQSAGATTPASAQTGAENKIEDAGDVSEDLTFFDTLKDNAPAPLTPGAPIQVASTAAGNMAPAAEPPSKTRVESPAAGTQRRSVNDGVMIQVLVSKDRASAETLRKKLRTKGFTVAIIPERGSFKVRVGPYADRAEAERIAGILKDQEHLSTWIP